MILAEADPTRRAILVRLAEGPATVNELADPFKLSLPAVSKHLKVLRNAGLVSQGRDAQRRPCHLEAQRLHDVADWAERFRANWEEGFVRLDALLKRLKARETNNRTKTNKEKHRMETTTTAPENEMTRQATISLPSDRETVITREFDAPARLVFDAFTKPELVRQWYGLCTGTMTVCEIDLRPGGHWRFVQEFPDDGVEAAFSGVVQEIDAPNRVVQTEEYEAMPGTGYLVTTTFAETDGCTTVTSHMPYQLPEHRDGHLQSGMEWGTNETYARLDEFLATQV